MADPAVRDSNPTPDRNADLLQASESMNAVSIDELHSESVNFNGGSANASDHNDNMNAESCNDFEESSSSKAFVVNGVKYWIPSSPDDLKPYIGLVFDTLEEGIEFYKKYAKFCGFSGRLTTVKKCNDGTVTLKHVVCHRQGFNMKRKPVDSLTMSNSDKKCSRTIRCDCKAKCCFRLVEGYRYSVYGFVEEHNHLLVSEVGKQFLRANRHLSYAVQKVIVDCGNVKIGASKAGRLVKQMAGGYDKVGATPTDVKNFRRDLKTFIGGSDAQMVVNNLEEKKLSRPGFFFELWLDGEGTLCRIFWADCQSNRDRKSFGDVVSFDATYGTNTYKLVFVPFTGVDNHKSSVILAAGLIHKEDIESYLWLLNCFKKLMDYEPTILITDEDPSLKIVVPQVFPNTTHQYLGTLDIKKRL